VNGSTLTVIQRVLAAHSGVRLAFVFGSVARGSAGMASDLDVAMDADPSVDLAQVSADLAQAVGRETDIVSLHAAGVPLLEEILRDGILVYEGRPHAAARWRAHVLSDLEIDRAWYARMRDAWLKAVAERGLDGQS
jgi:uncharacterized protein